MKDRMTAEELVEELKATLVRQDITRYQLAANLKISPTILSDVLNGRRDPTPAMLEGLGLERHFIYVKKRRGTHSR
jgi:transcriptional regulator with XRE-family HTH domain